MDDPNIVKNAPNLAALLAGGGEVLPGLEERAKGALLGLACGNLLGLPVESWERAEIFDSYPDGVTEIDPEEKRRLMDDDLAQAVELGEALLGGGDYIGDFARRLVRWRWENGRGMGYTTSAVIDLLEKGNLPPEAGRIIYEERDRIAPNGGVMRCAPVALRRYLEPERLVGDSAATCAVTHYAPTCQWSCIVVNVAIGLLLRGRFPTVAELAATALADGAPEELEEWMMWVGEYRGVNTLEDEPIGHTLRCMQAGLWGLATQLGFEDALVAVVSAGGDTDTNGAVAGAVLGARYGVDAIPRRWLECIPQRERLEQLAEDLVAAAG